ncbi:uncharacterized protein LOC108112437 [Drosophila eugracilis]|uniref:uncharacterized protein LOC108112437 n=1 Tax=Drosophila eugracilis TaxID=29029 RepID=UPI0007E86793|nr:uncharacterized protein LOC108112437 [Drosophila eugracilis]
MRKATKPVKRESPSDEEIMLEEDSNEMEDRPEHSGSSNGDSDEEGQQDQKEVDSIIAEMDEEMDKEHEAAGGEAKESEELRRQMDELSLLAPADMAALIRRLEKELYELSQWEAKELIRSKHLRIFGNSRRRSYK